jgi:hypothetical protein
MTAKETGEPFLERWSRLKQEGQNDAPLQTPAQTPSLPAAEPKALPDLPPVEQLTFDSDYRAFFHSKVDEDTRRAALKKLFSDSRFNVMDGLDVYIDDYSKTEPIPPAMLAGLRQAQKILEWAKGEERDASRDRAAPDAIAHSGQAAPESSLPPAEAPPVVGTQAVQNAPDIPDPPPANRSAGNT